MITAIAARFSVDIQLLCAVVCFLPWLVFSGSMPVCSLPSPDRLSHTYRTHLIKFASAYIVLYNIDWKLGCTATRGASMRVFSFFKRKKVDSSLQCHWKKPSACGSMRESIFAFYSTQVTESSHTVQYVSVIAWVFDFRKFITITDVSLQAMHIACAPIASICSQHGLTHERYTKYLIPWGVE